jgi:hypothetical protein
MQRLPVRLISTFFRLKYRLVTPLRLKNLDICLTNLIPEAVSNVHRVVALVKLK